MKKNNNKGFTLAELLIVVAIIGVLIAIAIPTFSGQLEKAKIATDEANVRAAYAEAAVYYIENDTFASSYNSGGITCTASKDTDGIKITVAEDAGQKSDKYKKGLTYKNGIFTATP